GSPLPHRKGAARAQGARETDAAGASSGQPKLRAAARSARLRDIALAAQDEPLGGGAEGPDLERHRPGAKIDDRVHRPLQAIHDDVGNRQRVDKQRLDVEVDLGLSVDLKYPT